jgi:hypothetical protein
VARFFFDYGLRLPIATPSPVSAQAHRLLGHVALDLAQPRAALAAYNSALAARQALESPGSPALADVHDSLVCSYTELGVVALALEHLAQARAIHEAHDTRRMARSRAIDAMTRLRAGEPDAARLLAPAGP